MKQPVVLRIFRSGKLEGVRQFTDSQIVIGSSGDVNLLLESQTVSALHATIAERGGSYYLSDLGSRTGTYKNNRKVLEESIQSGDEIAIGEYKIQFHVGVPKAAVPPVGEKPKAPPRPPSSGTTSVPGETRIDSDFIFNPLTQMIRNDMTDKSKAPPSKPIMPTPGKPVPPKSQVISSNGRMQEARPSAPPPPPKKKWNTFAPSSPYKSAREIIKPGKGSVAEIVVLWHERVLSTNHFSDKGEIYIGGGSDADVVVPTLSASSRYLLVKVAGQITVCISPDMSGELIREADSFPLADLARQNKMRNLGSGFELDVRQGEMVRINLSNGLISIIIRYKNSSPKPAMAPLFDLSAAEVTGVILAIVISAIFSLYMSLVAPTDLILDPDRVEEPIRKAVVTFNPPKVVEEIPPEPPKPKPPEPKKVVNVSDLKQQVKSDVKSDQMKAEKQKPNPSPTTKPSIAKNGPPGQAGEVAPKKTQDKQQKLTSAKPGGAIKTGAKEGANMKSEKPDPTKTGLLGVFATKGAQKQLDQAYSGSGELVGMADKATGAAGSNENRAGDSMGTKLKDTGAGGKGDQTIGIAGVGTKGRGTGGPGFGTGGLGQKGSVKVDVGGQDATFSGSIDREAIRRVILAHKAEIRFCYDKELQRQPGLAGKISIVWNITETGSVSKAGVDSNDMGNAAVANCIVQKLKTWGFPQAPPDVEARVIYPFVFTAQ